MDIGNFVDRGIPQILSQVPILSRFLGKGGSHGPESQTLKCKMYWSEILALAKEARVGQAL